jgi:hypothetical protein
MQSQSRQAVIEDLQAALEKLAGVYIKGSTSSTNMRVAKERIRDAKATVEAEPVDAPPIPIPTPTPTPTPETFSIPWGARINGSVYGETADTPWNYIAWDKFESHAGKHVSLVHWGQPWGALDINALNLTRARGATSLISVDTGSTSLGAIAGGLQNSVIDSWATKAHGWGYPFLVRFCWEMNGNWYSWARSKEYVAAWRLFVSRVRAIAPNVKFVWCPNVGYDTASWAAFSEDVANGGMFPGPNYVDWVGMDGYNRGTNPLEPDRWKVPYEVFGPTYQRLQTLAPTKPIMICETASTEYGGSKASWITNLLSQALPIEMPNVKALIWFNWNIALGTGKLDWPIESSAAAQAAFRSAISSNYYQGALL